MRVMFTLVLAAVLAACTPLPEPDIDPLAERYVRLSLEIGTHEEGYIDAYYGPPEWKTEAEAHPRSTAELKAAVDALAAELQTARRDLREDELQRRGATLQQYIASARFRLDMIDGARVPFAEEAEKLFGIRPTLRPLTAYDPILARIETLVPGRGALADRVEAARNRYIIPNDRMQEVFDRAIAECRRRTLAHIPLPQNESFTMEFVTDKSWSGYNYYQGQNRSIIQVNTDIPSSIDRAVDLGCHEGYPGHHVQGIYAEKLYRENGWVEYSVAPLFSPQGPLNEGAGNYGVDLAFPGDERLAFERDVLYPLAGLDPATAQSRSELLRAVADLAGARLTIAQMYLDGEINRDRAAELAQKYLLASRERAEQWVRFAEQYRSYVINYSTGQDLIRAYVERAGEDQDARWRAFQSILTQPTLPSDLQ
ncbi:hypothetical protein [Terricaulis sp.]|uniref:hypothetical protein n=1 Tax=Terricaulis sp. TaxID=2768686 RepID=UPI0037838301